MRWPEKWEEQLARVQESVNRLPYVVDAVRYKQPDFWAQLNSEGGDCEDYAIAKLRALVGLGWPIEALHLACCSTELQEYHAVLIVETPEGTIMLDNRLPDNVKVEDLKIIGYIPDVIQTIGGQPEWREWKFT